MYVCVCEITTTVKAIDGKLRTTNVIYVLCSCTLHKYSVLFQVFDAQLKYVKVNIHKYINTHMYKLTHTHTQSRDCCLINSFLACCLLGSTSASFILIIIS